MGQSILQFVKTMRSSRAARDEIINSLREEQALAK